MKRSIFVVFHNYSLQRFAFQNQKTVRAQFFPISYSRLGVVIRSISHRSENFRMFLFVLKSDLCMLAKSFVGILIYKYWIWKYGFVLCIMYQIDLPNISLNVCQCTRLLSKTDASNRDNQFLSLLCKSNHFILMRNKILYIHWTVSTLICIKLVMVKIFHFYSGLLVLLPIQVSELAFDNFPKNKQTAFESSSSFKSLATAQIVVKIDTYTKNII